MRYIAALLCGAFLAFPFASDDQSHEVAAAMTGGDPARGRSLIEHYGCGSCHTIPGIRGADALVGPSLDRIASRTYVAGVLENNPANMIRWISDPPGVDPMTAMPNLHLNEAEVRHVAAFVYTLR
jgi:cytochrome c551/c552